MAMTPPPLPMPIASPCIRVCTLSDEDVCLGCGRTLEDITHWSKMTEAEKAQCVQRAASTLQQLKRG